MNTGPGFYPQHKVHITTTTKTKQRRKLKKKKKSSYYAIMEKLRSLSVSRNEYPIIRWAIKNKPIFFSSWERMRTVEYF